MKSIILLISSSIFFSAPSRAEEDKYGFDAEVSVSGFLSPEIEKISIEKVYKGSLAEMAGLKEGG